ncbi:hypothetical protein [Micromonospora sp. HM5-17]|jgi:hypothetical protein|uniref:hypothetical protein n=1 Tax=Micromonospora sp. HM5-17 TaxID=2487710 RepID=UPI000F463836|nr:hypothetical protein [Micromonospora sp. HM5-17]ROT32579.1 hypothetical protein EF879_11515 [Micromonospora sp. HM5-17]
MVTTYLVERPSALSAALAPMSEARCILAAGTPRLPQAHQVLAQAELGQARVSAEQGTTGFTGNGIRVDVKRMDVSGVPPRGRPV